MDLNKLFSGVTAGNIAYIGQAISLLESTNSEHKKNANQFLEKIFPLTGQSSRLERKKTIRLGVSGLPGAGKSTFLEALGMSLVGQGLKVAVLAIDPSSPLTGGSILGDKVRMPELAKQKNAFIRPIPSSNDISGISKNTYELVLLCEAAGYDVVIIETVGVGQGAIGVASVSDCMIFLQVAGTGDDLQGIKKGIAEVVDILVINKDDGKNRQAVLRTKKYLETSMHIVKPKYPNWIVPVLACSAIENKGVDKIWDFVVSFSSYLIDSNLLNDLRKKQMIKWIEKTYKDEQIEKIIKSPKYKKELSKKISFFNKF